MRGLLRGNLLLLSLWSNIYLPVTFTLRSPPASLTTWPHTGSAIMRAKCYQQVNRENNKSRRNRNIDKIGLQNARAVNNKSELSADWFVIFSPLYHSKFSARTVHHPAWLSACSPAGNISHRTSSSSPSLSGSWWGSAPSSPGGTIVRQSVTGNLKWHCTW